MAGGLWAETLEDCGVEWLEDHGAERLEDCGANKLEDRGAERLEDCGGGQLEDCVGISRGTKRRQSCKGAALLLARSRELPQHGRQFLFLPLPTALAGTAAGAAAW